LKNGDRADTYIYAQKRKIKKQMNTNRHTHTERERCVPRKPTTLP
jgi:hypothetical protein